MRAGIDSGKATGQRPHAPRVVRVGVLLGFALVIATGRPGEGAAQSVEDGSDAAIGPAETRMILGLVGRHLKSPDAKVSALRRSEGAAICGSVDVKNRDGLYTGPRGFVVDLVSGAFDRVPDGPELLSARRGEAYETLERQRRLYFGLCLD